MTCGGGIRSRSRDCNMTSYGDLTDPCIGISQENETCHEFDCVPLGMAKMVSLILITKNVKLHLSFTVD